MGVLGIEPDQHPPCDRTRSLSVGTRDAGLALVSFCQSGFGNGMRRIDEEALIHSQLLLAIAREAFMIIARKKMLPDILCKSLRGKEYFHFL